MRQVFAPHLGRHVVIGSCKIPSPHRPRIRLGHYLAAAQWPTSPSSVDYSGPAMSEIQQILGNDQYGCCVESEEGHFIGVVTGSANALYSYTTAEVLALYTALTGFNAAVPSTDVGTDPIACLNYLVANPYADGTKLAGYAEVDATNQAEVQFAISAFGNLKLWVSLPDVWINPFPSANGFVWDVASPDSNNGHCIGSCGYNSTNVAVVGANSQGVQVMTWGLIGTVTWAALAALFVDSAGGGAAVRITTDWVSKASGNTPAGLAYADLVADFNRLFGGSVTAPTTTPPAPAPTSPPTLAAATAATLSAFGAGPALWTRQQAQTAVVGALTPLWPSS